MPGSTTSSRMHAGSTTSRLGPLRKQLQAVYDAAATGDAQELEAGLRRYGAASCAMVDRYGCSPLFVAARRGAADCVSLLLAARASVHQANENSYTPLIVAALHAVVSPNETTSVAAADALIELLSASNSRASNRHSTEPSRISSCLRNSATG
mgnify:CR=1 FL=1